MKIEVFRSADQLDAAAANVVIEEVRSNAKPILGLATGGTPSGVYEQIVQAHREGTISFRHAVSFNLDEYVGLPKEHDQSYASYMNEHLFDHIDMPEPQRHIPNGLAESPEQECIRYDELLASEGRIDLQLLGLGHNGHIGFNEPDKALNRGTHVVELSPQTLEANARFFESQDEVPRRAITMGIGSILQAKRILLLVKGADKAEIVAKALQGPITTEVPASLLQTHPDLLVMLDEAAAARLSASAISTDHRPHTA